jgi:hypothetical protein
MNKNFIAYAVFATTLVGGYFVWTYKIIKEKL